MRRKKKVDRSKIIKALFFWLIFLGFINFFPPADVTYFLIFYLILISVVFFTFKIFFSNLRSIAWTIILVSYLLFRQFKMDNIINILLLSGILLTLEIYFQKNIIS